MERNIKNFNGNIVKKVRLSTMLIVAVVVLSVGVAVYSTLRYNDIRNNPQQVTQKEQESLLNKVSTLIDLPKDEKPSIATVSDKEKLKEQAFFKSAKNGDTLLIYTSAKKAILYRESTNRIVEVAPIAIDTTQVNADKKP